MKQIDTIFVELFTAGHGNVFRKMNSERINKLRQNLNKMWFADENNIWIIELQETLNDFNRESMNISLKINRNKNFFFY